MLTQEKLKEILHYCPDTGVFTRLSHKKLKSEIGKEITGTTANGYRRIKIGGIGYKLHKLAFLYETGVYPDQIVDHIDGNKINNVFSNLRLVTNEESNRNRRFKPRGSKHLGVYKTGNRWRARITINSRHCHVGTFDTEEEAIEARKSAEIENGYHVNHGISKD